MRVFDSKAFAWFCWLGILLPLTLEGKWRFPVGGYHVRLQYFFFGLWAVASFCTAPLVFKEHLKSKSVRPLYCLLITALMSTCFVSAFPSRSLIYTVWSIGTALTIPFFIPLLLKQIGRRGLLAFAILSSALSLIACWDAFACKIGALDWAIAGVNAPKSLCRPHVFYQEPSYFAGFQLFAALVFRRHHFKWAYALACVGVFISGSRMGWIGLGCIALYEIALLFKEGRRPPLVASGLVVVVCALAILKMAAVQYALQSFIPQSHSNWLANEISSAQRFYAAKAAIDVGKRSPLIGVGPGTSGAYFMDHLSAEHSYSAFKFETLKLPNAFKIQRNDPLTNDLVTEVFSEWGILGLLLWGRVLVSLWRRGEVSRQETWFISMVAFIVYFSNPVLPRFDLWLTYALLSTKWILK